MKPRIENIYDLTPLQRGMLAHSDGSADDCYHVRVVVELRGRVEPEPLRVAFCDLHAQHEALRSVVVADGVKPPRQIVLSAVTPDFEVIAPPGENPTAAEILAACTPVGIDLARAPLCRLRLFAAADGRRAWVVLHVHHLIVDGWSVELLIQGLFGNYRRRCAAMSASTASDGDLHRRYRAWLRANDTTSAEAYWVKRLTGSDEAARPLAGWLKHGTSARTSRLHEVSFDRSVADALRAVAVETGVTEAAALTVIWGLTLQLAADCDDVVFGAVSSGRNAPVAQITQLVGLLAHSFPVRLQLRADSTFREVVQEFLQEFTRGEEAGPVSLSEVGRKLGRTAGDLFDHVFVVQNIARAAGDAGDRSAAQGIEVVGTTTVEGTEYPLTVKAYVGARSGLTLLYDETRISREGVVQLADWFQSIARAVAAQPDRGLAFQDYLTDVERRQLGALNPAPSRFPSGAVGSLVAEIVACTPRAPALVTEDATWTYAELDQSARRVAASLQARGIGPGDLVAVYLDRSPRLPIAWLATWYAGAAYLPIDTKYPGQRVGAILADARPSVVIIENGASLDAGEIEVLPFAVADAAAGDEFQPVVSRADDPAYVMYTSGTTGQPNGVLVEHRAIVRLIRDTNFLQLGATDRLLQTGSPAFDASTLEIWGVLANGATLYFAPDEVILEAEQLERFLRTHRITVLWLTTSLFNQLCDDNAALFGELRCVVTGGEQASADRMRSLAQRHPQLRVVNGYGPTENTTFSTTYEVETPGSGPVPIGRPIWNSTAYVLNRHRCLVPPGARGELYVGGAGLARGYLNRPELTAQRFVPGVSAEAAARLYRTGDIVSLNRAGEFMCHGRRDEQVKVRGYRIELGEIAAAVRRIPGIRDARVVYRKPPAEKAGLCAYYLSETPMDRAALRSALTHSLPEYMIPTFFVRLEALPLTRNGKTDLAGLPPPPGEVAAPDWTPSTERERAVVALWREFLPGSRGALGDDFFNEGGSSLTAGRLLARLRTQLGVGFRLGEFFARPTLGDLIARVALPEPGPAPATVVATATAADYPVAPQQKRLYLLQQLEPTGVTYNVTGFAVLKGAVDADRVRHALRAVARAHEALRTSFAFRAGELRQLVASEIAIELAIVPEPGVSEQAGAGFRRPFDLERGPLWRATLIRRGAEEWLLGLDFHHAIVDGRSLEVLLADFTTAYNGGAIAVPARQYRDYVAWDASPARAAEQRRARDFWIQHLGDPKTASVLQTDFPRPERREFRGERTRGALTEAVTASVAARCRELRVTPYVFHLAALYVLLRERHGGGDFIFGTAVENRPTSDLERTVGYFANTLALRCSAGAARSFAELLARLQPQIMQGFEHSQVAFDDLVKAVEGHDHRRNPLFDVMFAYEHRRPEAGELEGLSVREHRLDAPGGEQAKFDLTFILSERDGHCGVSVILASHLFRPETGERLIADYLRLVEALAADPHRSIAARPAVSPPVVPAHPVLPSLGESLARTFARAAGRPAVSDRRMTLTYAELDRASDGLAAVLRAGGVGPQVPVAVLCDRSAELVVALVAVIKAGGMYVPIDRADPVDRIRYILRDTQADWLITDQAGSADSLGFRGREFVLSDATAAASMAGGALSPQIPGETPAYVIYTSGTTGRPKGVVISRESLAGLLAAHQAVFGLQPDDRCSQVASPGFDAMVFELWPALAAGAHVWIAPREIALDPDAMQGWLEQHRISVSFQPTALVERLLRRDWSAGGHRLRTLMTGGEQLRLLPAGPVPFTFFNLYGPTEHTVWTTGARLTHESPRITIGQPIPGKTAVVVAEDGQQAETGELVVGGSGVAVGYLNHPELTADKFVRRGGERHYRTGDLVRLRPDADLEFIGRSDNQVKIRGYRIELDEIEASLRRHPAVKEAAVVVHRAGEQSALHAYVVASGGSDLTALLRAHVGSELPRYMVPDRFAYLSALPLGARGKVDRAALPVISDQQSLVAPALADPLERVIAEIWRDVLGRGDLSATDRFFDVGGNSLHLLEIKRELHRRCGSDLSVAAIYEAATIRALATLLAAERARPAEPRTPPTAATATTVRRGTARLASLSRGRPGRGELTSRPSP